MYIFLAITFIFLFWILPIILAYKIADSKNRNHRLWAVGAFFFGWLAVIILALQSKRTEAISY